MKLDFRSSWTIVFVFLALLVSPVAWAAQLTITIDNIQTPKGKLHISIYSDAESYKNERGAIRELEVAVDSSVHTIVVEDLAEGEYAVQLVHDENNNGKFDTNFVGIPKEGYGFSNNGGRFGPPRFEKALFRLSEKTHINIKLH